MNRKPGIPWSVAITMAVGMLVLLLSIAAPMLGYLGLGIILVAIADVVWKSRTP